MGISMLFGPKDVKGVERKNRKIGGIEIRVKRQGKYVIRPILKEATHMSICPKGCDRKPEDKITWKKSKRKHGFVLDWYCPVCGSKLSKVKITPKMRETRGVKVLASDYDAKKKAKKKVKW